ncbi:hypothetical protein FQA39_LY08391 [Lamprigera yunnana]|nr:hypothetical protein FQA39_LY08391 [Lamprigera yunnana]
MIEIKEQVGSNSGQINGICKRLREQGNKFIDIEAKINQDREEKICKDLKEQNREIVNYIEKKTGNNLIMNYRRIEKEAPKFHPSNNEHPKAIIHEIQNYLKVVKKQIGNKYDQVMKNAVIREAMREEYRNFQEFQKEYMKNYWGTNMQLKEERPYQGIQFYLYNGNGNNRSGERNLNINHFIQQPKEDKDRIEGLEDHHDANDSNDNGKFFVQV